MNNEDDQRAREKGEMQADNRHVDGQGPANAGAWLAAAAAAAAVAAATRFAAEYEVLEDALDHGLVEVIENVQVQFHETSKVAIFLPIVPSCARPSHCITLHAAPVQLPPLPPQVGSQPVFRVPSFRRCNIRQYLASLLPTDPPQPTVHLACTRGSGCRVAPGRPTLAGARFAHI
jgi:hypothetical protein